MRLSLFVLVLLVSCSVAEPPEDKPKATPVAASSPVPPAAAAPSSEAAATLDDDRVSIIQLIANPARFDGKTVWVEGYLTIGLENNTLCMVAEPGSSQDCLWVHFYSGRVESEADYARYRAEEARWEKHSGHRVMFEGVFDASDTGHLGMTSGGIRAVGNVNLDWDDLSRKSGK